MLIGLGLALLVQTGWLLLLQLQRPNVDAHKRDYPLTLRLIAEPAAAKPMTRPALPTRPATATPTLPARTTTPADEPNAAPPATSDAPAPQRSSQVPASTLAAPLNLALPPARAASSPHRESMLSQMLNDSRSRSAKRTIEWAVADAAGGLPITSGASTDGTNSKVIRQGSKCIRVAESRIKTLNPMDDNARGAPDAVGKCD